MQAFIKGVFPQMSFLFKLMLLLLLNICTTAFDNMFVSINSSVNQAYQKLNCIFDVKWELILMGFGMECGKKKRKCRLKLWKMGKHEEDVEHRKKIEVLFKDLLQEFGICYCEKRQKKEC